MLAPVGLPLTEIVYPPIGVARVVAIVSVDEHVGVQGLLLKVAVAPAGKPEAFSVIAGAYPPTIVLVTVVLPDEPWVVVILPLLEST